MVDWLRSETDGNVGSPVPAIGNEEGREEEIDPNLNKAIWVVPRGRRVVPRGVQDKIRLTKKGNKRQGFCRIMTVAVWDEGDSELSQPEEIHSVCEESYLLLSDLCRRHPDPQ